MATYWVNNVSGDDGNSGDETHPWEMISHAVGEVAAGDTIKVVATATAYTDYFTATTDGTSGSRITLTSSSTTKPTIDMASSWQFQCDYWTISNFDFNGFNDWAFTLGGSPMGGYGPDNAFCNYITIEDCTFRHTTHQAMLVCHATHLTVQRCIFRDLRARSAGVDLDAIDVWGGSDITISGCLFEDIGSDGVHIGPKYHQIDAVTIQDCLFRVNRPYGSETWQDYSTNVAENAIDIKGLWSSTGDPDLVGPVLVTGCVISGFQAIVSGQDCSDSPGELGCGIVVHMDATPVTVEDTVITGCDVAITGSNGDSPGSTYDFEVHDCVFYDLDNTGIILFDHAASVVVDGTIIEAPEGLEVHSSHIEFTNNIVDCSSFTRADQSGYTETFAGNCWVDAEPTSYPTWQSGSDTDELPEENLVGLSVPADGEMSVETTLRTAAAGAIVAEAEADFQSLRLSWLHDVLGLPALTLGTDQITAAAP